MSYNNESETGMVSPAIYNKNVVTAEDLVI